ncbi:MAG: glycerophosphodiester phosphodiesterase family protein [Clostridia bacterium]
MWLYERPITHRGLHNKSISENSLNAYKNSIEHNYNIEIDVHLLKSGEIVVFHDFTLTRMCKKNVKISNLTLADIKSDEYLLPDGQHIPLLSEVLELINGKTGLLIELKLALFSYKLENELLKQIKGKEDWIAIQAFNPLTVIWYRKHAPEFERGILSSNIVFPITMLAFKKMQPTFASYDIKNANNPRLHKLMEKYKSNMLTWTINSEDKVNKSIEYKSNNIIFENIDLDEIGFDNTKITTPKYQHTSK